MQTIEYRTVDKSSWPRGPWDDEPDKKQWQDAETGLPCLIVRNGGGALCGYVGVGPSHPFYGKGYNHRVPVLNRSEVPIEPSATIPIFCEALHDDDGCVSLDCLLRVHGGITFADGCHSPTRQSFEKWREMMLASRDEMARHPQGDSARRWRDHGHLIDDFEAWKAFGESAFICHVDDGDPVHWFGFDCSHSGDRTPAFERLREWRDSSDQYRDLAYVQQQVASLAKQLATAAAQR